MRSETIAAVGGRRGVVVGCSLDLVLRHVDEDLLLVAIDALDDTGGNHAFLPEDPEAGVDDEAAGRLLVRGFVDLSDVSVDRFDVEPGDIGRAGSYAFVAYASHTLSTDGLDKVRDRTVT